MTEKPTHVVDLRGYAVDPGGAVPGEARAAHLKVFLIRWRVYATML